MSGRSRSGRRYMSGPEFGAGGATSVRFDWLRCTGASARIGSLVARRNMVIKFSEAVKFVEMEHVLPIIYKYDCCSAAHGSRLDR